MKRELYKKLIVGGNSVGFTESELEYIYDYLSRNNVVFEEFCEPFLNGGGSNIIIDEGLTDDFNRYLSGLYYTASPRELIHNGNLHKWISISDESQRVIVATEEFELIYDYWIVIDDRCRFKYCVDDNQVDDLLKYSFHFEAKNNKPKEIMQKLKKYLLSIDPSERMQKMYNFEWMSLIDVEKYHFIGINAIHKNEFKAVEDRLYKCLF